MRIYLKKNKVKSLFFSNLKNQNKNKNTDKVYFDTYMYQFLDFPDKKPITEFAISLQDKMIPIGTYGFVRLVDCMPRVIPNNCKHLMCYHAIVQAARVSFNEGLKTCEKDVRLIDFLIRHKHTSPFEHNSVTFLFMVIFGTF